MCTPGTRLLLLCLPLLWLTATAAHACPMRLPTLAVTLNGTPLVLEVAATPEARGCGLSRRDRLDPDHGMLFVSPQSGTLRFWMKDTTLPLSIAFIDESGLILDIQAMTPMQTRERYRSPPRTRFAIEVNQGWFERHGVAPGQRIHLRLPDGLEVR
jgi:hypothetical protein